MDIELAWQNIKEVAEHFEVSPLKLWDMYCTVMASNFWQDLWDVAKENLEELKGE